jgi:hypothetical protein
MYFVYDKQNNYQFYDPLSAGKSHVENFGQPRQRLKQNGRIHNQWNIQQLHG